MCLHCAPPPPPPRHSKPSRCPRTLSSSSANTLHRCGPAEHAEQTRAIGFLLTRLSSDTGTTWRVTTWIPAWKPRRHFKHSFEKPNLKIRRQPKPFPPPANSSSRLLAGMRILPEANERRCGVPGAISQRGLLRGKVKSASATRSRQRSVKDRGRKKKKSSGLRRRLAVPFASYCISHWLFALDRDDIKLASAMQKQQTKRKHGKCRFLQSLKCSGFWFCNPADLRKKLN